MNLPQFEVLEYLGNGIFHFPTAELLSLQPVDGTTLDDIIKAAQSGITETKVASLEIEGKTYYYELHPNITPDSSKILAWDITQWVEDSRYDSVTGVYNRKTILELAEKEFNKSQRHNRPFSLLMLDIDHFKGINDTYGHLFGDYVLGQIKEISAKLRISDSIGKYGGEEFLVVLPETDVDGAEIVASRLNKAFNDHPFLYKGEKVDISISIGVASLRERFYEKGSKGLQRDFSTGTYFELIDVADKAMYDAKRAGRNTYKVR
jgi:diguanylate cyclase (GGDEF)-like protein